MGNCACQSRECEINYLFRELRIVQNIWKVGLSRAEGEVAGKEAEDRSCGALVPSC